MDLHTRTTAIIARPIEAINGRRSIPETFGEKRPCVHSDCITRLHRYHGGEHCYVHEGDFDAPADESLAELMATAPGPV